MRRPSWLAVSGDFILRTWLVLLPPSLLVDSRPVVFRAYIDLFQRSLRSLAKARPKALLAPDGRSSASRSRPFARVNRRPTALGATRPSLVAEGASCFCVRTCRNKSHSGSRLRRRFPLPGGSECPTPTESTLGHNRRCTLFVTFDHRRKRGEHLTTSSDHKGSTAMPYSGSETDDGRCIPSLLALTRSLKKGA
jgi:hypothetical protein